MQVTVRLFAQHRELLGQRELSAILPAQAPAEAVLRWLAAEYPRLGPHLSSVLLAVNREFVSPSHPLQEGDEVAVIPPVSGG